MELGQNWRRYQEVFSIQGQKRRGLSQLKPDSNSHVLPNRSQARIILVTDGAVVLWRFSECPHLTRELNSKDFLAGRGISVVDLQKDYPDRDVIVLDRSEAEDWMREASKLQHFAAYEECLKSLTQKQILQNKKITKNEVGTIFKSEHFILGAIASWWNKVLPSSFGILVCHSDKESQSGSQPVDSGLSGSRFLLIFRRGKLDSYDIPDLTGFIRNPQTEREALVKFLSERYHLPIQGLFVSESQWVQWGSEANPWKKIAKSLREDSSQLVPMKMSLVALIGAKAYF